MKKMKRLQRAILTLSGAGLVLQLTGCGTTTRYLVEKCSHADPDVKAYTSGYWRGGTVAVAYSLKEPSHPVQVKLADSYWAELRTERLSPDRTSNAGQTIHRKPLPAAIATSWKQIAVRKAGETGSTSEAATPVLIERGNWLTVMFVDKKGTLQTREFCPERQTYVPASKYPVLIILYPIALIGNVFTDPINWLWSGWEG